MRLKVGRSDGYISKEGIHLRTKIQVLKAPAELMVLSQDRRINECWFNEF
jgi:hypothetical protein